MSTLDRIDRKMPLTFYACSNKDITDPEMVTLAKQMQMPNLLKCDVPLAGVAPVVISDPDTVGLILDWLRNTPRWKDPIEETLQGMAQDSAGKPLLTAFMPTEEFAMLAADLKASAPHAELNLPFAEWHSLGGTTGYFDGYELQL